MIVHNRDDHVHMICTYHMDSRTSAAFSWAYAPLAMNNAAVAVSRKSFMVVIGLSLMMILYVRVIVL